MAKVIHIRNVPDDVHAALTEAAEARGLSLTKYVQRELEQVARADFAVQHNLAVIREVQAQMPPDMDPELTLELLHEGRRE
ncbi:hypothetical protein [Agrococcus sp. ARC_14]|uniref:FitA-like ribbon-helix-helix domain-containing protein n=1 Tax=Agrococcus sp. ARC_14 TaxID=2919927 RepID=UPI001F06B48F|nr:hypothetical protein [Agrococcus sp. ARC_14]MCH1883811.1 hypothetical protein [Agrococcus sp. ARC_14]